MKIYLLNSRVRYRSEDGVLTKFTVNNEVVDEVILTVTANRILLLLIEFRGQTLTRETLLNKVWEENGLTHSNNTLIQYVSLLRKILTQYLEEEDIIRTIPKVGYIFDDRVQVDIISAPAAADILPGEEGDVLPVVRPRFRVRLLYIVVSVILCMVGILVFMLLNKKHGPVGVVYTLNKTVPYEGCDRYVLSKNNKRDMMGYTPDTVKVAYDKLGISCQHGKVLISYFQGGIRSQGTGVVFLATCFVEPGNKKLESCQSYNYRVK
ncbi:winged helix-turn-helix domain-containing protein [Salmonella enterica]|uniref:winged helix-turn-helix domain-containing protein n=1 Tax=Salmonella enterica TaxID=28901 RepID=UPI00160176B9|nr:winged helix-turn-helix domain-containing protein [Salmonella enterica]